MSVSRGYKNILQNFLYVDMSYGTLRLLYYTYLSHRLLRDAVGARGQQVWLVLYQIQSLAHTVVGYLESGDALSAVKAHGHQLLHQTRLTELLVIRT